MEHVKAGNLAGGPAWKCDSFFWVANSIQVMDLTGWDARYRSRALEDLEAPPTQLAVETARGLKPGMALDLACGTGRNSLWLAEQGWSVTAVDGAAAAIEALRERATASGVRIQTEVADLKAGGYRIIPSSWDLITICYYLQRDLFETALAGVRPGGLLLVIAHIAEDREEATENRLAPGELRRYFEMSEILHYREGKPNDPAHRRGVAEIVVRGGG